MRKAAFAVLVLSAPAWAHDTGPVQQAQAPDHDPAKCYCRAQGRLFAPGESVCLKTAHGGRLAECQMVTNVMSWGVTDKACPES